MYLSKVKGEQKIERKNHGGDLHSGLGSQIISHLVSTTAPLIKAAYILKVITSGGGSVVEVMIMTWEAGE